MPEHLDSEPDLESVSSEAVIYPVGLDLSGRDRSRPLGVPLVAYEELTALARTRNQRLTRENILEGHPATIDKLERRALEWDIPERLLYNLAEADLVVPQVLAPVPGRQRLHENLGIDHISRFYGHFLDGFVKLPDAGCAALHLVPGVGVRFECERGRKDPSAPKSIDAAGWMVEGYAYFLLKHTSASGGSQDHQVDEVRRAIASFRGVSEGVVWSAEHTAASQAETAPAFLICVLDGDLYQRRTKDPQTGQLRPRMSELQELAAATGENIFVGSSADLLEIFSRIDPAGRAAYESWWAAHRDTLPAPERAVLDELCLAPTLCCANMQLEWDSRAVIIREGALTSTLSAQPIPACPWCGSVELVGDAAALPDPLW